MGPETLGTVMANWSVVFSAGGDGGRKSPAE
jgi:hypothetical protein